MAAQVVVHGGSKEPGTTLSCAWAFGSLRGAVGVSEIQETPDLHEAVMGVIA